MIVNQQTISANTPAIKSTATALASNPSRVAWNILNLDTNPLYVCLGGDASASVFHRILAGGTGANDGTGGSMGQSSGVVFTGKITVYSAGTASYTVLEE